MNSLEVKRFSAIDKEKVKTKRENAWAFSSLSNRLPERTVVYASKRRAEPLPEPMRGLDSFPELVRVREPFTEPYPDPFPEPRESGISKLLRRKAVPQGDLLLSPGDILELEGSKLFLVSKGTRTYLANNRITLKGEESSLRVTSGPEYRTAKRLTKEEMNRVLNELTH